MRITDLSEASSLGANEYTVIDDGSTTRKYPYKDAKDQTIAYTSGDESSPSAWKSMTTMGTAALSALMGILSTAVSNVRWLYSKLGTTAMGTTATTVTGAIAEHETDISGLTTLVGNTTMGTTATTVTGAVAEHEGDISTINNRASVGNSYSAGTYTTSSLFVSGYVTSGGGDCILALPMYVDKTITSITISSLKLHLRNWNNYVPSDGYEAKDDVSWKAFSSHSPIILLCLTKSGGWGATNNSPVIGLVDMTFTLA